MIRRYGFPASAPMFIPGFGAFIQLRGISLPPIPDSRIGLAGPVYGLGAALAALGAYYLTGVKVWGVIAHFGAWVNLFNLVPVWQLDGSRGLRSMTRYQRGIVLVAAGTLWHGSLPFVPGFDPYDVEVHVRRAQDLGKVPFTYDAMLRYGSHLPTETQTFGTATAALGERTLIPYSPLPYVFFHALERAGIDLHWGMIALDAALLMAIAPWLWVVTARVWSPAGAWIATILYVLDLPVWHHLGRAHVPASFGNALGTAALLYLALEAGRLDDRRRIAVAAAAVAVAALGYSSLIVIFGLFGFATLVLVAADARALSVPAKKGLVAALVLGGLLAGVLFYFHYVPGLLQGAGGIQQEPDLFQARTYLFFHNESRQSMRVWAAGFLITLVAGLLAAPIALRRAWAPARPVFAAWLATWVLVMIFKEPFLFPRPMRWAKEDQFIGPLLAIFIGAALGTLPRPWMRWAAGAAVVAVALWLQLGDFRTQMTGLMP